VATLLGRSASDVAAIEQAADRGLFDAVMAITLESGSAAVMCRPVIGLLGGYRRGTLPVAQVRSVELHVYGPDLAGVPGSETISLPDSGAPSDLEPGGCVDCRNRLALGERLRAVVPLAIVPGLVGFDLASYRTAVGAGGAAFGAAVLEQQRSARMTRLAQVGAVAGVVLALLAAAVLIRAPFGDLSSTFDDFVDRTTSTTEPPSETTVPGSGDPQMLPSRIELLFPGALQGAVYVPGGRPLNLAVSLSTAGPVYAGGTGTIDAGLTNNDSEPAAITYFVRTSEGISFDGLAEGAGTCRREDDDGATCSLDVQPGQTRSMSLRFAVADGGPDRLVIDPSISSPSLDVPVSSVPGLLIGEIVRGDAVTGGNSLGSCAESSDCPAGRRDSSSAVVQFPDDAVVGQAVLVWEGESSALSQQVGFTAPGGGPTQSITSESVESVGMAGAFRSVADVTELVREHGRGRYTVEWPGGTSDAGDGSWTLVVVTNDADAPRRLVVVVAADEPVTGSVPLAVDVPISGSVPPAADAPDRPLRFTVQARSTSTETDTATQSLSVDGVAIGGDDPFAVAGAGAAAPNEASYDLEIASTEDALSIFATTTGGSLRVAALALVLDIVS
ncbi:MAG: hypothetical protein WBP59_09315, partial [Ilumatobacteraceae bacterium]